VKEAPARLNPSGITGTIVGAHATRAMIREPQAHLASKN
jgi:hypothetical protein